MAKDFELDLGPLRQLLAKSPEAAGRGARQAMDDIKDDWVRQSRDIAPLDTGNLRRQISGEVEGQELNSKVIVTANAAQKGFNCGYYIHEENAGGKSLRTTGTVKKFLDESADEAKWQRWLEEEIRNELDKAGW
ncbi:hypothetical protein [Peribacillus frigoritolerans]|uniref:hypothetical protein n=1 Tax=Peribacillus frigoritolerans TaxID=450367 RepID=UPI002E1E1349|nr:hypothetical protein [Peribacillus frigoritolerans]MED3845524.1 hypothetical protein [Peribacillus frigoritolerans]